MEVRNNKRFVSQFEKSFGKGLKHSMARANQNKTEWLVRNTYYRSIKVLTY